MRKRVGKSLRRIKLCTVIRKDETHFFHSSRKQNKFTYLLRSAPMFDNWECCGERVLFDEDG